MFRSCELVVINKTDLLPHLDFDVERLITNIDRINPEAEVMQLSARTGEGTERFNEWLFAIAERRPRDAAAVEV